MTLSPPKNKPNADAVLTVDGLSCVLGGQEILKNVSLAVAAGACVSLIGPNGAGKTTLLKCLNRILPFSRGAVTVDGRRLSGYSQPELAAKIAYVPQAQGRFIDFTVFDFVLLSRYPHLSPFSSISAVDKEAAFQALVSTGMEAFADRSHATLSGGERQKVFIAAALAQESPILLLDEPTTFLDPHHQEEIMAILQRVNQQENRTILAVTHDLNNAMMISDQIIAMRDGTIMFQGSPAETMTAPVLEKIYGASFLFVPHPGTGQAMLVPGGRTGQKRL
ncbi:MAG: ABC transporter ATP-binding protein [Lentisphaeria bacterium]|nr:ABC transporter ATP-binding protein [Lentisphaeria bacterium]